MTLRVAPRSGPAEARPSLRRIWTVPKHEAAMKGYHDYVDYGRREIYTIEA